MRATDAILNCRGAYEEAAADLAARVAHESASQDVEGCRPSDSAPDPWEYTKSLLSCGDLAAW